jgi:hypothetical protein
MEPNPIALFIAQEMGFTEHKDKKGLYYLELGKGDMAYIDFRRSDLGGRYGVVGGNMVTGDSIPILVEYKKLRDKFLEMQYFKSIDEVKREVLSELRGEVKIGEKLKMEPGPALGTLETPTPTPVIASTPTATPATPKMSPETEVKEKEKERREKEREEVKKVEAIVEAPQIVVPRVDVETVIEHFNRFQELKSRVLRDEDYLFVGPDGRPTDKGKHVSEHIKKTGWSKLALIFNLNVEILKREKMWGEDKNGKYYVWTYHVRATAPNGRYQDAEGACSSRDPFYAKRYDPKTKEERWIEPDEKNIMLKAQTVAFNRAVSFLIGGGELSAEEVAYEEK